MAAPQGLAHFPGISVITSASMTLSHGITPSVCTIETVPHTNFVADVGTLRFTFGNVRIEFPECAVNHASLRKSGGYKWSLHILDRRWKWKYGSISGGYNLRNNCGLIASKEKKSVKELCEMLLKEMGEKNYEVDKLPGDLYPTVVWDVATPAEELAQLCDEFDFGIVLGLDNRVRILPMGEGKDLPGGATINDGYSFRKSLRPTEISLYTAPLRVQSKLELEAVGIETDGSIRPINDLSYKPKTRGGWRGSSPLSFIEVTDKYKRDGKTRDARELAKQSVFRMYRIKRQAGKVWHRENDLEIPENNKVTFNANFTSADIKNITQLLPLEDALLPYNDPWADLFDNEKEQPENSGCDNPPKPYVEGVFHSWEVGGNTEEGTLYMGEFSLDGERGIVTFPKPMFKVVQTKEHRLYWPASLILTAVYSFSVNDVPLRVKENLVIKESTEPITHIIHADDIQVVARVVYDDNGKEKGIKTRHDYRDEVRKRLQKEKDKLVVDDAMDVEYAGLVAIEPDGAIQQISWECGVNREAKTRASRNSEHATFLMTAKERRRKEMTDRRNRLAERRARNRDKIKKGDRTPGWKWGRAI